MPQHRLTWFALLLTVLIGLPSRAAAEEKVLKAGIIGLDTSHVVAFTRGLNDPKATGYMAKVEVVAAYPGGSPDIPASANRVEGFTKTLSDMGVEIVDSIDELLKKVDVVLLESVDGRPHLEQVTPVIKAGKPVFIDKPLAGSLADAIAIYRLAEKHKVPVFSSSSLRFSPEILDKRNNEEVGDVLGCVAYSPCALERHHPDLFWYGIHGVETLFTVMGPGCETVTCVKTPGTHVVTGVWNGGRVGTFRGIRSGKSGYGGVVFGSKAIMPLGSYAGYGPLLERIAEFFHTGEPPVSAEETLNMFAFMEAADESVRQGGKPVSIADVMKKAEEQLKDR